MFRVRVRWMSTIGVRGSLGLAVDMFRSGFAFGLGLCLCLGSGLGLALALGLRVAADSNEVPPHEE